MRVLIGEDQPQVRFALRVALEQRSGHKTIGEAVDAEDLLVQALAICPDLVLIDWELTGMSMANLIQALRRACTRLRVIVLNSREETRAQAMAAGADAFVCMCDAPDELSEEIDKGLNGEPAKECPSL